MLPDQIFPRELWGIILFFCGAWYGTLFHEMRRLQMRMRKYVACFVWIALFIQTQTIYSQNDFSNVPGVVIDHHPASTKNYIGSPSIAVLPDGSYVGSHDFFGPGPKNAQTRIFSSKDKGQSWEKIAELDNQFWSTIFVHQDNLYLIGTTGQNGHCIIRRSTDGGHSWTTPDDKKSGLLIDDGKYHCAPQPVVVHEGRLWRGMEDAMGPNGWGEHFHSFMMSIPVNADLLNADNWILSERIGYNGEWLNGKFGGFLEGNAVVTPEGEIVNILRVDYKPEGGKAAMIQIGGEGKQAEFDPQTGFIDFPGGCKKFTIRKDPQTEYYWSLTNWVPRNTVALIRSKNLIEWEVRSVVLYHPDTEHHAFQYLDWLFEGDDIIAVSRTAYDDGLGGAHNQHDANFMTFHRFENFREMKMSDSAIDPKRIMQKSE